MFRLFNKNQSIISFSASLIVLMLSTCISPVNVEPPTPDRLLIVDGFITNDEGPFEVTLQRLTRFAGVQEGGSEFFEKDAEVYITDQNGVRTDLHVQSTTRTDIFNGCPMGCCLSFQVVDVTTLGYRPPENFRGEIGNTYTLNIITFNGRVYRSTPQTILAGPEIDSVSYAYRRLPSSDNVTFQSGIDIFASWQDPSETKNFHSWRINGIYKIETPPSGSCCLYLGSQGGPGDGTVCWISERNIMGNVLSFSDDGVNGAHVTQKVGFIQDDGLRFANRSLSPQKQYYVEVEQLSMSAEAFEFTKILDSQIDIDGDIFDPPPAEIRGNITNVNNPDEVVIGFFGAYSVQKNGTFVNRDDLEDIQFFPSPCGDCRVRAWAQVQIPEVFR